MNQEYLQPGMRVAALYCLFGDTSWLLQSYLSIYPCVERVMFFVSSSPWYGSARVGQINTSFLQTLPDPLGKVTIIHGDWKSETEQRNVTLAYAQVSGLTHGFIVDADEVYNPSQLSAAFELIRLRPDIAVWHVNWFTYWKSPSYRIDPIEPYQPPIVVALGRAGFAETRNALGDAHELIPPEMCMCHHLSYALDDVGLARKHIMQPGHSQSATPGWYEQKWKGWDADHSIEGLHPINPLLFKRAIAQPRELLPPVLQELVVS